MSLTAHRVIQYIALILLFSLAGGVYWYFSARGAVSNKTASKTGLVGYWSFDEGSGTGAGDASGNGNTGTLTNGPTWVDGKLGKGVNFDGVDDYINVPSVSGFNSITTAITFSAWVKSPTPTASRMDIIQRAGAGSSDNWWFNLQSGKVSFYADNITGGAYKQSTTAITSTDWTYVSVTYDGANIRFYINGTLDATIAATGSFNTNGTVVNIGRLNGVSGSSYFNGQIDALHIYNRALSATEITNLYNLGAAKLNASKNTSLTDGLVGLWSFDGADVSGTTAYDRSGSANNGTLTNGPATTIGKIGQGLSFDGTNDYVAVTGSPSVQNVSYWIKPTGNKYSLGLSGSKRYFLNNGLYSGVNTATRYINGVIPTAESLGSELVTNGTLETGNISPWSTFINTGGGASGSLAITTSSPYAGTYALDANITNGGTIGWHWQIFNGGSFFYLSSGTLYKVQFAAKGSVNKSGLTSDVRLNDSPYTTSGPTYTYDLTTSWVLHTYYFYSELTSASMQVLFDLGNNGAYHIYLDNISVKAVSSVGDVTNNQWNFVSVNMDSPVSADSINLGNVDSLFLNGTLDDVRFYNRALSATEIQSLYYLGDADKINSSVSQPQGTGRLDSGLQSYWSLDENTGTTTTDASTNGATGTLTNGPTWTTGQISSGVDFDGTDDYITAPDADTLDVVDSRNFVLSGWFNRDTFTTDDTIVAKRNGIASTDQGYIAYIDDATDKLTFESSDATDEYQLASVSTFTATGWHHFALVWNDNASTETKLYIDGVAESATATGTFANVGSLANAVAFRLGAESDAGNPFDGKIDEARLYNRTMTADEIAQLYRRTTPTGVDTGLKGYWSFDGPDLSGTTAFDRSGAGNTGTLTSGPTATIGKIGQGLSFDGVDDYVNIGDKELSNTTISISAWFKPLVVSQVNPIVNKYEASSSARAYILSAAANSTYGFSVSDNGLSGAGALVSASSTTLQAVGVWHYVVGTFDGIGTVKIYVNGVLEGTNTDAGVIGIFNSSRALRIGNYESAGEKYTNGSIDDVRIYNRVLSASEITALYNSGR